jgi:hypothetical protein
MGGWLYIGHALYQCVGPGQLCECLGSAGGIPWVGASRSVKSWYPTVSCSPGSFTSDFYRCTPLWRDNIHARELYERWASPRLESIPGGFRMKDGTYQKICLYYHEL